MRSSSSLGRRDPLRFAKTRQPGKPKDAFADFAKYIYGRTGRLQNVYNYCFLPRTTTVDVHFAKYHYRRAPKDLVATSSSPNVNVYFHDCCKNNYFHDVREPLPSPRRCWIRQVPL